MFLEIGLRGLPACSSLCIMSTDRLDNPAVTGRLEALGNASRLANYRLLVHTGPSGTPAGEIQRGTRMTRSTLSHHVHGLLAGGLVRQEHAATTLMCRTSYKAVHETRVFLQAQCCADAQHASAT